MPKVLKMVKSSEQVDERSCDVSSSPSSDERKQDDEKKLIEEATEPEQGEQEQQGDKEQQESNAGADSNGSQSPIIPFSASSAINSFPARRVSSSCLIILVVLQSLFPLLEAIGVLVVVAEEVSFRWLMELGLHHPRLRVLNALVHALRLDVFNNTCLELTIPTSRLKRMVRAMKS
jgi:Flp pilus assembly protein TadB